MATDPTALPTPSEFLAVGQGALRSGLNPQGTGAVNLQAGSDNDVLLSVNLAMYQRLAAHVANRVKARSRSTSTSVDLTVVGNDNYYLPRKVAAAAVGTVYLQRTATAATVIPFGTRFAVPPAAGSTQPPVVFSATQDVPVALNGGQPGSPIAVPIQCAQTGTVGNVQLIQVTAIQDTLPDTTWAIAPPPPNPDTIGGGIPDEDDDTYRNRLAQGSPDDTRIRGTKRALLVGALTVAGIVYVDVVESQDGTVLVVAGDPNYQLPSALRLQLLSTLDLWRCFGVPPRVIGYTTSALSIVGNVFMQRPLANYNAAILYQGFNAALQQYMKSRTHADEYFVDALGAAIESVLPTEIQTVSLSSPGSSVKRLADSAYASATSFSRYYLPSDNSTISLTLQPPTTQ